MSEWIKAPDEIPVAEDVRVVLSEDDGCGGLTEGEVVYACTVLWRYVEYYYVADEPHKQG